MNGVILTGPAETAGLFQSWKPDLKLLAETSGKNAMVITPNADLLEICRVISGPSRSAGAAAMAGKVGGRMEILHDRELVGRRAARDGIHRMEYLVNEFGADSRPALAIDETA